MRSFTEKKLYYSIPTNTNIDKVEVFHVLHDNVAVLMGRRSERGTRNCHQSL